MTTLRIQLISLAQKIASEQSGMAFDSGHCESEIFGANLLGMVNKTPDASLSGGAMAFLAAHETNEHQARYTQQLRKTLVEEGLVVEPMRATPRGLGR